MVDFYIKTPSNSALEADLPQLFNGTEPKVSKICAGEDYVEDEITLERTYTGYILWNFRVSDALIASSISETNFPNGTQIVFPKTPLYIWA